MRISDWSSDVVLFRSGIAATATDNFQVVTGQRIVTCNLALIERRVIMPRPDFQAHQSPPRQASSPSQIGRASCRERVCQYVSHSVVAVSLRKKKMINGVVCYLLYIYLSNFTTQ